MGNCVMSFIINTANPKAERLKIVWRVRKSYILCRAVFTLHCSKSVWGHMSDHVTFNAEPAIHKVKRVEI